MLPPAENLKNDLLNLKPTSDPIAGISNFVKVIASYVNQVQGGPTGSPGIFTLNEPTMVSLLSTLPTVSDNSWVPGFVNAFQLACASGIITPGTVSNPAWVGSGSLDILTLPAGAATILTLSPACLLLQSQLISAKPDEQAPIQLAQSIKDTVSAFTFNCIGLGPPPAVPPIPIPTPSA